MAQLLEIRTTPIALSLKSNYGKLEYTRATAQMEISRQKGGLTIEHEFPKLNIDTFEARTSLYPTTVQSIEQSAEKGKQAAAEAAATYTLQGKRCLEAPIGQELVTQFVAEAEASKVKTNIGLDFIPKAPAKLQYIPGEFHMRYEADQVQYDWRVTPIHFDVTRAHVDIQVAQYPDVQIKYIADPIRVPRTKNSLDILA